jgi:glycine/D-amino acid oxidase-like deaminating enzyme
VREGDRRARPRFERVSIRQGHEVTGFIRSGERCERRHHRGGDRFEARAVVIATGAWSGVVGEAARRATSPCARIGATKFMTRRVPGGGIRARRRSSSIRIELSRSAVEGRGLLLGHGRRDEPDSFNTEIDRSLEPRVVERAISSGHRPGGRELMRPGPGSTR